MEDIKFAFPVKTLLYEGNLIVGALEKYSTRLAPRLTARGPTFTADIRSLYASVASGDSAQKTAGGSLGGLTEAQDAALTVLAGRFKDARESAKKAFKGQDVKLHEEFQVGINDPRDIGSILARARIVHDSCNVPANAAALALVGWIAPDTAALAAAIKAVEDADKEQETQKGNRLQSTGDRNTDANRFYDALLAIQNAANLEFTGDDSNSIAIRTEFRFATFPPASGSSDNNTPPPPSPAPPATPPHA